MGSSGKLRILVKLLDSAVRLPAQAHPDKAFSRKYFNSEYGKTESWYILDKRPDAKIFFGFKDGVTKESFIDAIHASETDKDAMERLMEYREPEIGDTFLVPAKAVHAIGAGILIAEIQQNSNSTYRVSDYGRLGADGKPRPLHIEKAIAVTKTHEPEEKYGNVGELTLYPFGMVRTLASCDLFTAELLSLNGNAGMCEDDSFISLIVLEGEAVLSYPEGNMRLKKGDSVFVPAGLRFALSGKAEIICSHV